MSEIVRRETAESFVAWELPAVAGHVRRPARGPRTERELEALRERVRLEAREEGLRAGQAEAQAQIADLASRFEALMNALCAPFAELDEQVEDELVTLAITVSRQLVRRELATARGEIVAVVREALSVLPVSAREVRLHLHPDDADLIEEVFGGDAGERRWSVVRDPVIECGGCRVSSDSSQIDATLEKRLTATVRAVFGDERAAGRRGGPP